MAGDDFDLFNALVVARAGNQNVVVKSATATLRIRVLSLGVSSVRACIVEVLEKHGDSLVEPGHKIVLNLQEIALS